MTAVEPPGKVLLVDDDADALQFLHAGIEPLGYEIVDANSGMEALEILAGAESPRIVVLDWHMSQMTGIELCKRIRRNETNRYTYLILLTVSDESDDVIHGLNAGADDYIIKPVDVGELEARIAVGTRLITYSDVQRQTTVDLASSNSILKTFSRTLVHDLRITISNVKGCTWLLADTSALRNDEDNALIQVISNAARRMQFIVDDVLMLETTANLVKREMVDPRPLIMDAAADAIGIVLNIGDLPKTIDVQPQSFGRALKNLFENAARYGKHPGSDVVAVTIFAMQTATSTSFIIDDDGPGVPADERNTIFEPFRRGGASTDAEGTGLGLSIVAMFARTHGGDVGVGTSPDGGARFILSIETHAIDLSKVTAGGRVLLP